MDAQFKSPVMERIIPFTETQREHLVSKRQGETKLGEKILLINENTEIEEALQACASKYVVVGIPEDIGVKANFGKPGAESAWSYFLPSFLNLQSNQALSGDEILLLGQVNLSDIQQQAQSLDPRIPEHRTMLYLLVSQVDVIIAELTEMIIASGKTLIAIGGGHNNSYPIIKGTSLATQSPLVVLNFDPHADLRAMEGRHSGNGFSYAYEEGYLSYYHVFGLQEELNNTHILSQLRTEKYKSADFWHQLLNIPFENWKPILKESIDRFATDTWGLEIDCDCITHFPASAYNANGLSESELRSLSSFVATYKKLNYIHICEAAPILEKNLNKRNASAKFLALLVAQLIKAQNTLKP